MTASESMASRKSMGVEPEQEKRYRRGRKGKRKGRGERGTRGMEGSFPARYSRNESLFSILRTDPSGHAFLLPIEPPEVTYKKTVQVKKAKVKQPELFQAGV